MVQLEPRIKYPPGIQNCGRICIALSVLHLLLNQKLFINVLRMPKCGAGEIVVCSSARCVINSICQLLTSYQYADKPEEHDSQEFLMYLMELMTSCLQTK